jgi:hypothetical protein
MASQRGEITMRNIIPHVTILSKSTRSLICMHRLRLAKVNPWTQNIDTSVPLPCSGMRLRRYQGRSIVKPTPIRRTAQSRLPRQSWDRSKASHLIYSSRAMVNSFQMGNTPWAVQSASIISRMVCWYRTTFSSYCHSISLLWRTPRMA